MASETNQITKKRLHTFLLAAQVSDLEKLNAALTMLANWGGNISQLNLPPILDKEPKNP